MTDASPGLTTEQFADKIFDVVRGAASAQALYLGDRLGWYRTLASEGPLTATELADKSGTDSRYAREWLEQQVVSGVLAADVERDPVRFELPREHAAVLVDTESTSFMLPLARLFAATGVRLPDLVRAYRTGGGVSWAQLGDDAREAQGAMNRPVFATQLTSSLLPQVPDLHRLLTAGGRVADIGCGEGWASIALAVGYPSTRVHGIDVDAPSIAAATRNAAAAGVADRVTFDVADAAGSAAGAYDAVFAFECIHDLPDPVAVLSAMRRIAAPGAPVIVMDERTADAFTPDAGPVEELLYGYSILCCLPDGMSHENTVATGTVMRASTLDAYARSAGFDGAAVLPIDHDFFRFYRLQ
ncbi:methyltransferase domain-containing protein [Actinomycetes bacterium M1A6_2h]